MPSLLFSFQPPTGVADPRRDETSLASITRQLANLPSLRSRGELAALVQSPPFRFPRALSNLSAVSYQRSQLSSEPPCCCSRFCFSPVAIRLLRGASNRKPPALSRSKY